MKRLGLVVAALLTLGATKCDPDKLCPPGQVIVVLPGGGLACQVPASPSPSPTPTLPPTTTTSTTTTTTMAPMPSPTPTGTPEPPQCELPANPECGGPQTQPGHWGCCWEERPDRHGDAVNLAVETVKSWDGMMHPDGRVVNEDVFMASVVSELRRAGYCAQRGGPDDELATKKDNGYSEQHDLLWGSTVPRKPWVNHTVSCQPARFD